MIYKLLLQTAFCTLFAFGFVYGQAADKRENAPMMQKIFEQLNLTDARKKEIGDLNDDHAKQRVQQQAKIRTAVIELHQLMRADSPDKSSIEKKIREIAELQAQNRMLRINHWFAVNKLLNPDQQKIWKKALTRLPGERFEGRMQQMRGRRMHFHPPIRVG